MLLFGHSLGNSDQVICLVFLLVLVHSYQYCNVLQLVSSKISFSEFFIYLFF